MKADMTLFLQTTNNRAVLDALYQGFDDMLGRSGMRGGTGGCEFVPPDGRLKHINNNTI